MAYTLRSTAVGEAVLVFSADDEVVPKGLTASQVDIAWFATS
ncbi:hypothetical protein [Azospirillum picis]|uniref:Uncharacterized protein n=1 Tax=Azospirillum picis TaxID=488438 RepID=A0ABU0MTZ0_9PROT|nr:hypothetical protein [Azospirillum picis]MBP2303229.1 hypothetical protein [Azospirillum picis]MDQ0536964.1 hypothetical protein [Azospirillum picis]